MIIHEITIQSKLNPCDELVSLNILPAKTVNNFPPVANCLRTCRVIGTGEQKLTSKTQQLLMLLIF